MTNDNRMPIPFNGIILGYGFKILQCFGNVKDFSNICHSLSVVHMIRVLGIASASASIVEHTETNKSMIDCANMVQSSVVKATIGICAYAMCSNSECVDVIDERQHRKHIAVLEETLNSLNGH